MPYRRDFRPLPGSRHTKLNGGHFCRGSEISVATTSGDAEHSRNGDVGGEGAAALATAANDAELQACRNPLLQALRSYYSPPDPAPVLPHS